MRPHWMFVLSLVLAGCGTQSRPLPTYKTVPEFALTERSGKEFDSRTLMGKVWVADFIFTTCTGPCPRMSSQMHQIQTAIKGLPGVKLVSFTVDPKNDTPEVLAAYARRFRADPNRWYFLTGPPETLQKLDRDVFMLGNVDGSLNHSTRFVLIDAHGKVRGYYMSSEPEAIEQLITDIRLLVRTRA